MGDARRAEAPEVLPADVRADRLAAVGAGRMRAATEAMVEEAHTPFAAGMAAADIVEARTAKAAPAAPAAAHTAAEPEAIPGVERSRAQVAAIVGEPLQARKAQRLAERRRAADPQRLKPLAPRNRGNLFSKEERRVRIADKSS